MTQEIEVLFKARMLDGTVYEDSYFTESEIDKELWEIVKQEQSRSMSASTKRYGQKIVSFLAFSVRTEADIYGVEN